MNNLFLPKHTKFYGIVAQLKPAQRYFFTLIVLSGMTCIFYTAVYAPQQKQLIGLQAQMHELQQQLDNGAHADALCAELGTSVDVLRSSLQEFSSPTGAATHQAPMLSLITMLQKSGLTLSAYTADKEQKKDWYTVENITLATHGTMDQMQRFFDAVAQSSVVMTCEGIEIMRANTGFYTFKFSCGIVSLV